MQSQLDNIFQCFLCLDQIQEPVLCPHCSQEVNRKCPHCRSLLTPSHLIKARFLEDIRTGVRQTLQTHAYKYCEVHDLPLAYYCYDCEYAVCSDSIHGDGEHTAHRYDKLKKVYNEKREEVKKHVDKLEKLMQEFKGRWLEYEKVDESLKREKVKAALSFKLYITQLTKEFQEQCDVSLDNVFEQMTLHYKRLEKVLNNTRNVLQSIDMLDVIKTYKSVSEQVAEVDAAVLPCIPNHDIHRSGPDFDTVDFTIHPFTKHKAETNILCSEPVLLSGNVWTFEVNCGKMTPGCLAVGFRLVHGRPTENFFELKVEMIGPKKTFTFNGNTEFCKGTFIPVVGFCPLSMVERDGYANNDAVHFRFHVRQVTWKQRSLDLENFIGTVYPNPVIPQQVLGALGQPNASAFIFSPDFSANSAGDSDDEKMLTLESKFPIRVEISSAGDDETMTEDDGEYIL